MEEMTLERATLESEAQMLIPMRRFSCNHRSF